MKITKWEQIALNDSEHDAEYSGVKYQIGDVIVKRPMKNVVTNLGIAGNSLGESQQKIIDDINKSMGF